VTLGKSDTRAAHWARLSPWREILIGLAIFALYSLVEALHSPARESAADRHSRDIFELERWLHIDIEPTLNRWLAPHDFLRTLANYEYATTYLLSALIALVWLYTRRPDRYREMRNSFVVMNVLAIATFWLYPMAPPRFLAEAGFVDTVADGRTWGSWGSPLVTHANQLAAMPSLHIAWALWVSVALAQIRHTRTVQGISLVHVAVTLFVIMATANHYLLDAAGAVVVVLLGALVAKLITRDPDEVAAPDAFFLYVESSVAAQHVGGLIILDTSKSEYRHEDVVTTLRDQLDNLPRFHQRLEFRGRWRRPRWVEFDRNEIDWDWHVPLYDLTRPDGTPGGFKALHELVAQIASEPFPRDRPMWRFVVAHGVESDRAAGMFLVHHVIADGVGTVTQSLNILSPRYTPRLPPQRVPGPIRRAAATTVGIAQLATDGFPKVKLPTGNASARGFTTVDLPLVEVRKLARREHVKLSDILMTMVAGGLTIAAPDAPHGLLRVSVPLMVRPPDAAAEGNLTAAVMTEVPLGPMEGGELARLAEIHERSKSLYSGSRTLASNFAMRAAGVVLPVPGHAWFARTVYGGGVFQAIVSNMPGPDKTLSMAGAPLTHAYPILPLAPRVPIAVGALGWDGWLSVGIATDPALVEDAETLAAAMRIVYDEMWASGSASLAPTGLRRQGLV
jgi:diacylglycerol O-acyltransferase